MDWLLAGKELAIGAVGEKVTRLRLKATLAKVTWTLRKAQTKVAAFWSWKSWRLPRGGNSLLVLRFSISFQGPWCGPGER